MPKRASPDSPSSDNTCSPDDQSPPMKRVSGTKRIVSDRVWKMWRAFEKFEMNLVERSPRELEAKARELVEEFEAWVKTSEIESDVFNCCFCQCSFPNSSHILTDDSESTAEGEDEAGDAGWEFSNYHELMLAYENYIETEWTNGTVQWNCSRDNCGAKDFACHDCGMHDSSGRMAIINDNRLCEECSEGKQFVKWW